jgi:flagellar biosynthesis protein
VSHSDDPGDGNDRSRQGTIAVALAYEPTRDQAPRVVAGGRGAIAEQILQVAFAHDVKVREDADLVQLLSAVGIDSGIPVAAFAAVAEILVYVYRANGTMPPAPSGPAAGAAASGETPK